VSRLRDNIGCKISLNGNFVEVEFVMSRRYCKPTMCELRPRFALPSADQHYQRFEKKGLHHEAKVALKPLIRVSWRTSIHLVGPFRVLTWLLHVEGERGREKAIVLARSEAAYGGLSADCFRNEQQDGSQKAREGL